MNSRMVNEAKLKRVLPADVWHKVEQAMRTGLFNTPVKRLSMGGGGRGWRRGRRSQLRRG